MKVFNPTKTLKSRYTKGIISNNKIKNVKCSTVKPTGSQQVVQGYTFTPYIPMSMTRVDYSNWLIRKNREDKLKVLLDYE